MLLLIAERGLSLLKEHTHTLEPKPAQGRAWSTGITTVDGAHHLHFVADDGTVNRGTGYHNHPELKGVVDGQQSN